MRQINLRNKPFYIHDDEDLSNAIARNGDYWEADILDYLAYYFPKHEVILDVGANIGNHAVYFARFLDYFRIYCFEPDPLNFHVLGENIESLLSMDFERKVRLHNNAISDVKPFTLMHLALNRSNWGAHEIQQQGITVEALPLDFFAFPLPVTLMKIDVEWHEPEVLRSAENLIKKDKPLILIEDANNEYGALLPEYELIQAWDHHKTYLYKWRE
jgi:FkbM family methyltransferase